jgi:hypothetical protein
VSLNLSSYSLFFLLVFSFFPLLFELISFYYPFPLLLAFTFGISQHSFPGYHRDYSLHPWLIHISIFTTSWTMQRTSFVLIIFKLLNIYIYRKKEREKKILYSKHYYYSTNFTIYFHIILPIVFIPTWISMFLSWIVFFLPFSFLFLFWRYWSLDLGLCAC